MKLYLRGKDKSYTNETKLDTRNIEVWLYFCEIGVKIAQFIC